MKETDKNEIIKANHMIEEPPRPSKWNILDDVEVLDETSGHERYSIYVKWIVDLLIYRIHEWEAVIQWRKRIF